MTWSRVESMEGALWAAMDALRGLVDAENHPRYVLGLLLLKSLSDGAEDAPSSDEAPFIVPPSARWSSLLAANEELGERLEQAATALEESNPLLSGMLTSIDFTSAALGPPARRDPPLQRLMESISQLPKLSGEFLSSGQVGELCDALLFKVAGTSGRMGGGMHHTPPMLIHLLIELMELQPGLSVCDPVCGAGSLLAACARHVTGLTSPRTQAPPGRRVLHGQEKNLATWALCRMNLLLHGILDARIEAGDVLRAPRLVEGDHLLQYDRVVADPPFSLDSWGAEWADQDPFRRFEPTPPKHLGDYAFIQHTLTTLAEGGRAAILVPAGVLFRGGVEEQIRQALVEADHFEAIIGLPGNLLYGTTIPAIILMLRRGKPASRQGRILFIDASRLGSVHGRQRVLLEQDIQTIVRVFRDFRNDEGFSRVVTLEEILSSGSNLNLARYVGAAPRTDRLEPGRQLEAIAEADRRREEAARRMNSLLDAFKRSYLDRH